MAIYPLALEGFENQKMEVQDRLLFGSHKLLVDGEPAPKGAEKEEMVLTRDDGRQVTARWQKSGLRRHILEVDGKTIVVKRSALWWELLLWVGAMAVALVLNTLVGGLLPGVFR